MDNATCPTCKQQSIVMIEKLRGGFWIGACLYCDLPQEEDGFAIYTNHCWNCGWGIDSRFNNPSLIPGMGYICNHCGKDLTEWKLRKGLITLTELFRLKGAMKCCTATSVPTSTGMI